MPRLSQQLESMEQRGRALQQGAAVLPASPTPNDSGCSISALIPAPRKWEKPGSDDYYVITQSDELVEIVNSSPLPTRFIRLPPGPLLFDIGPRHLMPPANTSTTIDCQGSIVSSSSRDRPPPSRGSYLGTAPHHPLPRPYRPLSLRTVPCPARHRGHTTSFSGSAPAGPAADAAHGPVPLQGGGAAVWPDRMTWRFCADVFDCTFISRVDNNNSIAAVSQYSDTRMLLSCDVRPPLPLPIGRCDPSLSV